MVLAASRRERAQQILMKLVATTAEVGNVGVFGPGRWTLTSILAARFAPTCAIASPVIMPGGRAVYLDQVDAWSSEVRPRGLSPSFRDARDQTKFGRVSWSVRPTLPFACALHVSQLSLR